MEGGGLPGYGLKHSGTLIVLTGSREAMSMSPDPDIKAQSCCYIVATKLLIQSLFWSVTAESLTVRSQTVGRKS